MKRLTLLAAICCLTTWQWAHADQHEAAPYTATTVTPALVLLQGKGGNILLSKGKDGVLIIDDGHLETAGELEKAINQQAKIDSLQFVLNTHWHGDHTGSNAVWGKSANIVAHSNVRERLTSRQEIPLFNMVSEPYPEHALPNLTYPDTMHLHFNGDAITLQHYPNGHTDGDSVVYFEKDNVVHMGDHLFYPMFPFVDLNSGGNVLSYAKNVGAVLARINDNTKVIPGHGPLTDKKGLQRFYEMLNGTVAEVKAMKASGLTLQQAQAQGLSDRWQQWNSGFIKQPVWIEFIYLSL